MFCPKCGSILVSKKGKLVCSSCGEEAKAGKIKEIAEKKRKKEVRIIKDEPEIHPKTKARCPECGHNEAYYWTVQTRAADEPPTRFYKCVKCGNIWREYS